VNSRGYQLVGNDWWAKTRGCLARTPAADELYHSEERRSTAIGWAWQSGIFALDTLPAVIIVALSARRWRRIRPGENP
jgi:hypothetical protein